MTFALAVRDNEKSERTIMRRLINRRSGTGESTEFTRQPDNRICVRRLRALDAYLMRADRLHASLDGPFKHNRCDSPPLEGLLVSVERARLDAQPSYVATNGQRQTEENR